VHRLAAQVLLAMAEAGTVANGPLAFGAEFSPIAVLPVRPEFAAAFAGLALQLLDELCARGADDPEAELLRLTALTLLGRDAEALGAAASLRTRWPAERAAALDRHVARIHLATGAPARALDVLAASSAREPGSIAGLRLEALAAARVGDLRREAAALEALAVQLSGSAREVCVFPDAAAMLAEVQLARARSLHASGMVQEARQLLLSDGEFGGPLAGASSARVEAQRRFWLDQLFGSSVANAPPLPIAPGSPLRWLVDREVEPVGRVDDAMRVALWRGWLPATMRLPADPRIAHLVPHQGAVPSELGSAPFAVLAAHVGELLQQPGGEQRLLASLDARLQAAPQHEEARLLRAVLLHRTGQDRQALECLRAGGLLGGPDLRARYLAAVLALLLGDRPLLREALHRGDSTLSASELDLAGSRLPLLDRPRGEQLLAAAE
jgi:hypothetical protein